MSTETSSSAKKEVQPRKLPSPTCEKEMSPLKFWEIENYFVCPVVGMCLSFSEQKQLLKKSGFEAEDNTPFKIHEALVACSRDENRLSRLTNKLLERKFGKKAAVLRGLDTLDFKARFKTDFDAGVCPMVTWAAATNHLLSADFKMEIFGDIHMSMHWNGEQAIKLKQENSKLRAEIKTLRLNNHEYRGYGRSLKKDNNDLRQQNSQLKTTLIALKNNFHNLKDELAAINLRNRDVEMEQAHQNMQGRVNLLEAEVKDKDRLMAASEARNTRLHSEVNQLQKINHRLQSETQEIVAELASLNRCDANCPSFDLCKKRILLVGGMTRIEFLYRDLVEKSGGVFDYHDGYMKRGTRMLENCLYRADVVICPISCNSHAACNMVKNLAKKHNKTVHMLANSSLSSIYRVLSEKSEGTIN